MICPDFQKKGRGIHSQSKSNIGMDILRRIYSELSLWDSREKQRVLATVAGALFSTAWLIFFNAIVSCEKIKRQYQESGSHALCVEPPLYLPGIASTLSLIVIAASDIGMFLNPH